MSQAALPKGVHGFILHTAVRSEHGAPICPQPPPTAEPAGPYEAAALRYVEGSELVFVASLVRPYKGATRRVTQCIVQRYFLNN